MQNPFSNPACLITGYRMPRNIVSSATGASKTAAAPSESRPPHVSASRKAATSSAAAASYPPRPRNSRC